MPVTLPAIGGSSLASKAKAPQPERSATIPLHNRASALFFGAVCIGLALRAFQYAVNRSLWLDEALLSASILNRDLQGLFEPLQYGQTAPIGFLALVWTTVQFLGSSEPALRLVPFVCAVVALLLFALLVRDNLPRIDRTVAIMLFSLSPYLIYYSSEAKQYSTDVLVSVLILWIATGVKNDDLSGNVRRFLPLWATGLIVVWFSQPGIFLLASVGIVLLLRSVLARQWHVAGLLCGVGSTWMVSFAAAFLASNRGLADREYMNAFWQAGFWPFPPRSLADLMWLPNAFLRLMREPLGVLADNSFHSWPMVVAGGSMLCLGGVAVWKHDRTWMLICVLPFFLALTASALHLYPFGGQFLSGGRVLLFLAPSAFLLIGSGAGAVLRWSRVVGTLLVALLFVPYIAYAAVGVPQLRAEVKPLLHFMHDEWQPGDRVYIHYEGTAQFSYYAPRFGIASEDVSFGRCNRFAPADYLLQLAEHSGTPRLWILFATDALGAHGFSEKELMLLALDRLGERLDDRVALGASLYLYDLQGADINALTGISIPQLPYELAFDCRGPWSER